MGEVSRFQRKAFCQVSECPPLDSFSCLHLRKALDNFVAAPLEEIASKLGAKKVISKVKNLENESIKDFLI